MAPQAGLSTATFCHCQEEQKGWRPSVPWRTVYRGDFVASRTFLDPVRGAPGGGPASTPSSRRADGAMRGFSWPCMSYCVRQQVTRGK